MPRQKEIEMVKQVLTVCIALAMALGIAGLPYSLVSAEKQEVTICHRSKSIKNPYQVLKVDADSVDNDLGNDNGKGDHYAEHTGPIADPTTMTNGDEWGDIIPPIAGVHSGLNWTVAGQAIYNNNCNYPASQPSGMLTVTSNCEEITFSASQVMPVGTTVSFTLDETTKTAGTYPVTAGSHTVKLLLNGKEVASKTIVVEECEDEGKPGYAVSLVCPVNKYTLTVANTGETDLDVEVNGKASKLSQKNSTTADFNVGDTLTVKVNGEFVNVQGKLLNNFKLVTCQGMGSTVTTNNTTNTTNVVASTGFGAGAATDVTSLPVTSGSSAQAAGVIMTLGTILAAAGAYLTRSRSGLSV